MRLYLLPLIALMVSCAYAFHATPIYAPQSTGCIQANATYISCVDGRNITVGFTVEGRLSPQYWNFSVFVEQNVSAVPAYTIFGGPCTVSGNGSNTCSASLMPFSIFSGNGTVNESLLVLFTSPNYPQLRYNSTMPITVNHYLNSSEAIALGDYESAFSKYTVQASAYAEACGYGVCNATVSSRLASINNSITSARIRLEGDELAAGAENATSAEAMLNQSAALFASYSASAGSILENIVQGNAYLQSAESTYASNSVILQNCTYSGHLTAAAYLSHAISTAQAYPASHNISASERYLSETKGLQANATSISSGCASSHAYSPSIFAGLAGLFSGPYWYYIVIAIVVILAALFVRSRIINMRELKRIRGEDEEAQELLAEKAKKAVEQETGEEDADLKPPAKNGSNGPG